MLKTLLLVVAGLGAGFAVAFWLKPEAPLGAGAEPIERGMRFASGSPDGEAADAAARIDALEAALEAEVDERIALEQRVAELDAMFADLRTSGAVGRAPQDDDVARESAVPSEPRRDAQAVAAFRERRGPATPEQQIERLVAGGFPPDRATWIQQRTAQLTLEAMQAQYMARREGQPQAAAVDPQRTLREELGDADYERYLRALGRQTSVGVFNVLAGSPGERAGLRAGDEIVNYAGQRVFDMRELNSLTFEGSPGESVVVDIVRDDQSMQVVVPRGPIGIGGGPFRRGP
jgi:PDZ domain-containing protein